MSEPTNISDKLKQTIDELEIDRHVNEFVIQVESFFTIARDKVASLAAERGDEVEGFLGKWSTTIDERTDGRYAGEIGKVRDTVSSTVARLAEQAPTPPPPSPPVWPVDEIEPGSGPHPF